VSLTRVTTTCPQCATIFRVNPEQLAARRGQVRCGRCRHVFNGYETVSIGPLEDKPKRSNPKSSDKFTVNQGGWWGRMRGLTLNPSQRLGSAVRSSPPSIIKTGIARDEFGFRIPLWKLHLGKLVSVGIICLMMLVFVTERVAIVQVLPSIRPLYVKLLSPIGLHTPYPGDAELWTVESSDLREDAKNGEIFHLSATLRNRSKSTQALPTIDLNITDMDGLSIEHQTISPDQYLSDMRAVDQGLPGNSELSLKLELKHSGKKGQGYRIVLFFP
jgi:predicted Zn finger-like uncharacterized protein